jgi:hypothetical protein
MRRTNADCARGIRTPIRPKFAPASAALPPRPDAPIWASDVRARSFRGAQRWTRIESNSTTPKTLSSIRRMTDRLGQSDFILAHPMDSILGAQHRTRIESRPLPTMDRFRPLRTFMVAVIRLFRLVCTIATRDLANMRACREYGLMIVSQRETFVYRLRIALVFSVRRSRASAPCVLSGS